jgi:hypothetical protein|tara:strand:- start:1299 stop:1445 length:147 start_codon:yes stop_codon:yes gene_type:complete
MINKNNMTTLAEVIGAALIIYGVYTFSIGLAYVVAGSFFIVGSYLISK